jgi:RNA polymerase sigma factor (sigma-70 family)
MDENEVKQLIGQVAAGNARAFRDLLDTHYIIIYRMAFRFCGNQADAEDVTQMTCMKLAQNINKFDGRAAFTTWLYQVVLNTARDWQRSQNRHMRGAVDIGVVENTLSTPENAEKAMEVQQQLDAVRALPEGEREAVWLVFAEGLSHKQAADILGCAEGTISYRIFEARKKLAITGGRKHG